MLNFSDVTLRRGPRVLFADATFGLFRGEKVGITGENGSGKSSLMSLVRGELHPDAGTFEMPPGAKSFVDVGDTVEVGDPLCIIEAMKLMNEIDSEYDGEIANIYVENGQPVQYGERLFAIRTR